MRDCSSPGSLNMYLSLFISFPSIKSRVVGPGKGERNFHIFYQLAKSTGQYEKEQLGMMTPNYFHYLNCSGEYNADGINDADEYGEMKRAMDVCSISKLDQAAIFDILAGILHLGNVDFMEEGNNAKIAEAESKDLMIGGGVGSFE